VLRVYDLEIKGTRGPVTKSSISISGGLLLQAYRHGSLRGDGGDELRAGGLSI
jgi:hypothetical protein